MGGCRADCTWRWERGIGNAVKDRPPDGGVAALPLRTERCVVVRLQREELARRREGCVAWRDRFHGFAPDKADQCVGGGVVTDRDHQMREGGDGDRRAVRPILQLAAQAMISRQDRAPRPDPRRDAFAR